jgi:hypothetical protein
VTEEERVAQYRARVVDTFAAGVRDLGPLTIDEAVPPFDGEAIVDLDVHVPRLVRIDELAGWAAANDVTVAAIGCWGVALPRPDDNHHLRRTHARESDMEQLRSWTDVVPALAGVRAVMEERIAPWLPFGATRRALVRVRRGVDPSATATTLEAGRERQRALAGCVMSEVIERWVPQARELAAAVAAACAKDIRAWAFLAKLGYAAVKHGHPVDLALLMPEEVRAAYAEWLVQLVVDRVVFDAAFDWATDPSLRALMTYRGVRLDDFAVNMMVRRYGHPGFA